MRRLPLLILCAAFALAVWWGRGLLGDTANDKATAAEEKAIRLTLEEFVKAFNANDAPALAATFTADAEYIDDGGNGVRGRTEIEKLFRRFFANNKGAQLQLSLDDVRLVTPTVALQDGESVVTLPARGAQSARQYGTVFAKQDQKWFLASVREFPETDDKPAPAERLKELEWLVGDWVDEGGDAVVAISCRWADDRKALVRDYSIKVKGKDALTGTQRLGVDPLTDQIKGWAFDSAGGHGETTWIKDGAQWLVKATAVTADGEAASATYVLKPLAKDRISWKTMHRVVGNRVDPDLEVIVVRKPPPPK
jgi:uncharacterized protein (TIGR02246 family)